MNQDDGGRMDPKTVSLSEAKESLDDEGSKSFTHVTMLREEAKWLLKVSERVRSLPVSGEKLATKDGQEEIVCRLDSLEAMLVDVAHPQLVVKREGGGLLPFRPSELVSVKGCVFRTAHVGSDSILLEAVEDLIPEKEEAEPVGDLVRALNDLRKRMEKGLSGVEFELDAKDVSTLRSAAIAILWKPRKAVQP